MPNDSYTKPLEIRINKRNDMEYTLEKIYSLVGKKDHVATLTFKEGSEAFKKYGNTITVVFMYEQAEREGLDKLIQDISTYTHGIIKANELLFDLSEHKRKLLLEEGINSKDITNILYSPNAPNPNTFHTTEKRVFNKHIIEMESLPKGGDLDWMYGFQKELVQEGIILLSKERNFYLAGKFYFEPQNLSVQEIQEIFDEVGLIKEPVELEFLDIKRKREEISEEEQRRLNTLEENKNRSRLDILDLYLKQAGSSLKKLSDRNPEQATILIEKVQNFNEKRLNVMGKHPIYIDIGSYLHIFMRHVKDFKINQHFEHKDNFQWNEDDVFLVMNEIIDEIDDTYQKFREENPDSRYSKYKKQSIYFQGDYYTFHIETTGRISTFHKNRKKHEQTENYMPNR